MGFLVRLLFLLLLLLPVGLAATAWFALAETPLVVETVHLSHRDVARAETILKNNDPRNFSPGSDHSIVVSEQDLNLALNYLIQRYASDGGAHVTLQRDRMDLLATVRIPVVPGRPYLNLTMAVEEDQGEPRIARLRIGSVRVPAFIAGMIARELLARSEGTSEYKLAREAVKGLDVQPGRLSLTYRWQAETFDEIRRRVVASADPDALNAYHGKLLALQADGIGVRGSFTGVLQPLFALARKRSHNGDPVAENRALLLVLGAWASGYGTDTLLPDVRKQPREFSLSVEQRKDSAQHFLVSAAIAAGADVKLSNAVGAYKEVADSRGGSGFSFNDLAADRAGTRFGELAVASKDSARRVQQRVSERIAEADIMPHVRDLPEGMSEREFKRRFGEVDSRAYRAMMEEIERRVAACPLYRR
jgi:hypothetical protein